MKTKFLICFVYNARLLYDTAPRNIQYIRHCCKVYTLSFTLWLEFGVVFNGLRLLLSCRSGNPTKESKQEREQLRESRKGGGMGEQIG